MILNRAICSAHLFLQQWKNIPYADDSFMDKDIHRLNAIATARFAVEKVPKDKRDIT